MPEYGFVRAGAASPRMRVADPEYNISQIEALIKEADSREAAVAVFPELCITGYTCADLFGQKLLVDKAAECLMKLAANTAGTDVLAIVGLPVAVDQKLYNCAAALQGGRVLGVVPKMYPANYKEFYEKRWFTSGQAVSELVREISLAGRTVAFGHLLFESRSPGFCLGVEICEDLWAVIPPSSYLSLAGATLIANLSASNDLVSKADYRRQLVEQQSARSICGYIYASSGVHESTTDLVFGGDCLIAENGILLRKGERFRRESTIVFTDIDVQRLETERQGNMSFADGCEHERNRISPQRVRLSYQRPRTVAAGNFERKVPRYPFIPDNPVTRDERCREIFQIQSAGLAKRLEHTGTRHAIIGVSGGLDSTLALLATARSFELLGLPVSNIIAVTMPGFGTTDRTHANALKLMQAMNVTIREISIKQACLQHFRDIGHNQEEHDITYENTQARERTQILMDLANKTGGLVVGTGDLSEAALGWSTYNGDHMSMYAINCSIPKTLVRFLVKWIADNEVGDSVRTMLYSIIDTPISPELLPPDENGRIQQKTEDVVGPYVLHDFFLYYAIRFGMQPQKILFLAEQAFTGKYNLEEIRSWLKVFYERFFSQQFKRSCTPDGPKVGTISLSPRGDWRMPSDAQVSLWLDSLLHAGS